MENGYHTNWTIDKWKIEKPFVKCCFNGSKGNLFCIELSRGTKNGFISRTRSGKNHGFHLVRSAHRLQGQIALAVRQCSVFGGTSVVCCTSSYWNLVRHWIWITTDNKLSIWIMRWSKNGRNGPKDMAKLSYNMTTLRLIPLKWWRTH